MLHEIVLFDTEYTAWEGSQARQWSEPWEHREIIQIAAVRIDLRDSFQELGSFNRLVKPQHNPVLSSYIIELTGIQQEALDACGQAFSLAFAALYDFCQYGSLPMFCWGDDPAILRENCDLNGLSFPVFSGGLYDIRVPFQTAGIDTRLFTSGTVYQAVGVDFNQSAHNALNDARSLAATLRCLSQQNRMSAAEIEHSMVKGKFM